MTGRSRRIVIGACALAWCGTAAVTGPATAAGERSPAGGPPASPALIRIRGAAAVTLEDATARWRATHAQPVALPTPADCREFLELLADQAVLAAAAERARAPWTADDRAAHAELRDRLVLRAALDSVLDAARRAAPDSASDPESLGLRARERVVAGLAVRFDAARVARLAAAFAALPAPVPDSSLAAQMRMLAAVPRLDAGDSAAVIARSSRGDVTAHDIVAAWSRIGIARRPRVETEEHVRNLAENLLFERALRAATAGFESRDDVRAALAAHARQVALERYLEREVLAAITPDAAAVRAYFDAHRGDWALPLRMTGLRLRFADRAAADRMAVTLRDAATADSLAARALRQGADYRFEASAASDSALFQRALAAGPGAVVGPVHEGSDWWVARVGAAVPARERSFAEVSDRVADRWYAGEVERRTRALAASLRRSERAEIVAGAADALGRAVRELPPTTGADVNPR